MGLLWTGAGHTIRRDGVFLADWLETFISGSALPMPALEGQVQADMRATIAGAGAPELFWIHIFTKVPVAYVIRVAPPGDPPEANWWL